jgi:hypothetical protein
VRCRELDGGHPLWALEALTGDEVYKYHRSGCVCVYAGDKSLMRLVRISSSDGRERLACDENHPRVEYRGTWRKLDLGHSGKRGPHGCKFTLSGDEALSDDDMFQVFKGYDQKDAVLAASSDGTDDSQQTDGLVQGHGERRAVLASGITRLVVLFATAQTIWAQLDGDMAVGAAQRIR